MTSNTNKSKQRRGNPQIAELGRATQFKPGRSGNPGGRPSRTPYADAHRDVAYLTVRELQILPTDEVALATAKSVAKQALKGKISAAAEAANRAEGTSPQRSKFLEGARQQVIFRVVYEKSPVTNPSAIRDADFLSPSDGDAESE